MSATGLQEKQAVLCEARHVSHSFSMPGGKPHRVLEDVSLAVHPGEIVALLGPSGCGKSTLLRILAGLLRPTAGEVLYHDEPLAGLSPGVAIVFQSFAIYPWMTVAENIRSVLKAAGLPPAEARERSRWAIRLIGLAGYEGAYPRELSGGMKQRVGMARALSVNPEILFLDEPFSQVDALTAESLRAEVVDIWAGRQSRLSSVLMVSHDIKEVAWMADRIVVMGAHPGRVRTVVENRISRPRDYRSPELLEMVDRLHDLITGHLMPDEGEAAGQAGPAAASASGAGAPAQAGTVGARAEGAAARTAPPGPTPAGVSGPAPPGGRVLLAGAEPLPHVSTSEIIGLLEYLDARGGQADVFRIAAETDREFGQLIRVIQAAEMLDLVDTPRRMVVLADEGRRFIEADAEGRQAIWRERILTLGLFQEVMRMLERRPDHRLDAEIVQEMIALGMPQENEAGIFRTLVRWGRYGGLFSYDERTRRLGIG